MVVSVPSVHLHYFAERYSAEQFRVVVLAVKIAVGQGFKERNNAPMNRFD